MKIASFALREKLVKIFYFLIITTGIVVVTWPVRSFSAYTRTLENHSIRPVDLNAALRSSYISPGNLYDPIRSEAVIERALLDSENRINPDFHVPKEIRSVVKFWLRIYTEYSTQNIVFFDSNNMDVIYEVLDFGDLKETARNAVVFEITCNHRIQKTLALYKKAFASLARNPNPKHPSPQEKVILSKVGHQSRKKFLELASSFKHMRGQRDNFMHGILAAEPFMPNMEMIFKKMGVPPELTRLSLVESSFNLRAISKVGASGVWQFMPGPGKKFLNINESLEIDERRSPLKSTVAAAKLLLWNYRYLGSWPLAVIAYNHGLKHLPRLKGQKAHDFAKIAYLFKNTGKKGLGWASRNYFGELLGALYAETYRHLFFGFEDIPQEGVRAVVFQPLPINETPLAFAIEKGLRLEEFKFLNADIGNIHRVLPKGYWIAVPADTDNIQEFVELELKHKNARHFALKHPKVARRRSHRS